MIKKKVTDNLKFLNNKMKSLKKAIERENTKLFKIGVKEVFKRHPDLNSFSWHQYTPYWNDGDECTFSVYASSVTINDNDDESDPYYLDSLIKDYENKDKVMKKLQKEIDGARDKWAATWPQSRLDHLKSMTEDDYQTALKEYDMSRDIVSFIGEVDEDTMKSMFGDHVSVTVTRKNGIVTEEYSHD